MMTVYIVGSFVFVCIFLFSLGSASAACGVLNDIPTQPNFDAYKYQGVWKEIAWIPPADLPVEDYLHAYTGNYALEEDGNMQHEVSGRFRTGDKGCIYFTLTWVPTDVGLAKFTIEGTNIRTWIVETDYVSYSVQYTCRNVNRENGVCLDIGAAIRSRRGYLTFKEYQKVDRVLDKLCLSVDMFVETTHENPCPPIEVAKENEETFIVDSSSSSSSSSSSASDSSS